MQKIADNLFQSVRSTGRTMLREFGRQIVAPIVTQGARRPDGEEGPVSVHILVSSKTWPMGLLAAHSFEYFTQRRWKLFIHEDGSVDDFARRRIERQMPGVRFVSRHEANAEAEKFLKNYPACLRNRSKHNLFLKFFDSLALAPHEQYIVLDADLFFYAKPEELLSWVDARKQECWFNQDTKEVYCLPRNQIEPAMGVTLWDRVNSGLCLVCKEAMSLDLSEKLLATFEDKAWHPQFFEQSLFALNGSAFNRGGMLPAKYEISWNVLRQRRSVCRHYVGPFKFDILYVEGPATLFWRMTLPSIFKKKS